MNMWDVGGQDKVQANWKHYFFGVKILIFVIDSSDRWEIFFCRSCYKTLV